MKAYVQITFLIVIQFLICQAAADELAITQAEALAAFERGKGLLVAGKVDEAIQELERGTQSAEKEVLARANLARAYFTKGEAEQAKETAAEAVFLGGQRIREAVADKTISAQLYVDRGFAWLVRREVLGEELAKVDSPYDGDGLLQTAIEDFEHAIELDAECFHAYRLMASAQFSLGRYGKSIEACDKAIGLQPHCLELYSYKAYACLESQRGRALGGALFWVLSKASEEGEELLPEDAANALRLSLIQTVGSRGWPEALTACNSALEIEPENPQFLLLRARAYELAKMYDKAIADCNKVIELEPINSSAYLSRAELLIQSNDLCAALGDYEKAARLDSRSIAQPRWVTCLYVFQEGFGCIPEDKVMILVERICAAAPNVGEVYLLRSLFNRVYEHQEAADKAYKKAFDVGLSVASREYFEEME